MDKTAAQEALKGFEELYAAGFISFEELEARKAELGPNLQGGSSSAGGSASGAPPTPGDDLSEDMSLKFQVFAGPFKNVTESVKLTFENSESKAAAVRSKVGLSEGACVVFSIQCEDNAKMEDLTSMKAALDGFFEENQDGELPFETPKVVIGESFPKTFHIYATIKPEFGGMGAGLIEAVVRHVDVQFNLDRNNYAAQFYCNLQGSRNMLELAQEMAGLPPAMAQMAQLYDSCDTTLRFKSILHLAETDMVKQTLPPPVQEQMQSVLKGDGLDPLLGIFFTAFLRELNYKEPETVEIVKNYFMTAFHNFKVVSGVEVVFGYSVFTLSVDLPGLFHACSAQLDKAAKDQPAANPPADANPLYEPYQAIGGENPLLSDFGNDFQPPQRQAGLGPQWSCGACTFLNDADLDKCAICQTPK